MSHSSFRDDSQAGSSAWSAWPPDCNDSAILRACSSLHRDAAEPRAGGESCQSYSKLLEKLTAWGCGAGVAQASILMSIRHPNIVLCMGVCLEPLQLVTEFCPRGSLSDCLLKARANPAAAAALTWPRRLSMALDAAKVKTPRLPPRFASALPPLLTTSNPKCDPPGAFLMCAYRGGGRREGGGEGSVPTYSCGLLAWNSAEACIKNEGGCSFMTYSC